MSRFQRRHQFREPKKFFIIATEGECTEAIYFSALKPPRDAAIQLKILPTRKGKSSPKEVLARLKSYDREAGSGPNDELWLVVDRDSWSEADLDAVAAAISITSKYNLALSNPCFELWLVLHRRDSAGQNSEQLRRVLQEELGSYEKGSYDVEALTPTMDDAIRRAERLDTPPKEPWPRSHGTHVYRLVRKLKTS
ncbi:MAG TPA: RloB family protein [Clostridia bacterium]|nr:RloB family protein [Clostridia bacterium]